MRHLKRNHWLTFLARRMAFMITEGLGWCLTAKVADRSRSFFDQSRSGSDHPLVGHDESLVSLLHLGTTSHVHTKVEVQEVLSFRYYFSMHVVRIFSICPNERSLRSAPSEVSLARLLFSTLSYVSNSNSPAIFLPVYTPCHGFNDFSRRSE